MKNRKQIAPASPKHMFICQSWLHVVMSFAYLDSVGDLSSHNFLILADSDKLEEDLDSVEIRQALALFGHEQVDWFEARQVEYWEVHLSPALPLAEHVLAELEQISYQRLVATGDNLNNRMYVDNRIAGDVVKVVHYGYRLIERALLSTLLPKNLAETSHVVSFGSILNTWQRLNSLMGRVESLPRLEKGDLLFCERHWGMHEYAMQPDADAGAYLKSVLRLEEKRYKRVIFRSKPLPGSEHLTWERALSDYAKEAKIEFVTWTDIYGGFEIPSILNHPEAQLFLGNLSDLGGVFAFDGSLAVLFGVFNSTTTVHWGDSVKTEDLFIDELRPDLVLERTNYMRAVSTQRLWGQKNAEDEVLSVTISGALDALAQKRAQLAAIHSSLSWRLTKPLRLLGKLFVR